MSSDPASLAAFINSLSVEDAPSTPSVSSPAAGPAINPIMAKSGDELAAELNRIPLFMTHLDETDGEGGENVALQGLKAIAYEGTRSEIADNFRQNGNECARDKQWKQAQGYYSQAIGALKEPRREVEDEEGNVVEVDERVEDGKERVVEEACYVNRALCNLELKNYRACNLDCAATLRLNPRNIKAWYRSASACYALDKMLDAEDACSRGLEVDAKNAPLKALASKIQARKTFIAQQETATRERKERLAKEQFAIKAAFKQRKIIVRATPLPPDTQDASPFLSDPLDPSSTLSLPVLILYPRAAQSDLIKAFEETHSLGDHLGYILPDMPWDDDKAYRPPLVDCYIATPQGGVAKVGKKIPLKKILESGKAEVVDGVLRIYVVPRNETEIFIAEFKKQVERERQINGR